MNVIQAIKERRSVRSFDGCPVEESMLKSLSDAIAEVKDPFGGKVTMRLKRFDLEKGFRPSTYGMIKGASDFFMIGMADDEVSALSAGFMFEQIVLKAWQMGLGTCWIAATFKGTDFDNGEKWAAGERLRIISPVGVAAKKSVVEKIARLTLGSKKRKPFSELFFNDNPRQPLSPESRYGESLEMVRLAPSSTNSQPWRAIVSNDTVHFYYVPVSQYAVLDCGIGLCHFFEAESYYGHTGSFFKDDEAPAHSAKWKYLLSYRAD